MAARRASERERVRNLVALDAAGLMARLGERQHEMIAMFSRHRDREPLLSPLRSLVPSAGFAELALLLPEQQSAVARFYEEVDALRWYFRYTADMPGTAQQVFAHHRKRIADAYDGLRQALGPPAAAPAPAVPAPPEARGDEAPTPAASGTRRPRRPARRRRSRQPRPPPRR